MFPLPEDIMSVMAAFAPLFSDRVWVQAQVLIVGAILTPGKRTVSAILRTMGLSKQPHFTNYHRVLNRATWNPRSGSRILLGLLVRLIPSHLPIVIGADDTIERRGGRKIKGIGCYRDPVRSSKKHVIHCFGLKWVSMSVLAHLPFSSHIWSLPFINTLCEPEAKEEKAKGKKTNGPKTARLPAAGRSEKVPVGGQPEKVEGQKCKPHPGEGLQTGA